MSRYNSKLQHRAGALNKKADLLSRRSDHNQGKDDNKDVVLLKSDYFCSNELEIEGIDKKIIDQIKGTRHVDTSVKLAIEKKLPGWSKKMI